MNNFKFPIALWTDLAGNVTARTLDGADACAVGLDDSSTIDQLKRYLVWHYKNQPYDATPDFKNAEIAQVAVPLRAQNESDRGRFPSETLVNLEFQYVWGTRADGSVVCCLPTLDLWFGCSKPSSLKSLVNDEIKKHFAESSNNEIAHAIGAASIRLASLSLRIEENQGGILSELPTILPEIALPLGERNLRRQFSAAWGRNLEVSKLKNQLKVKQTNVLLLGDSGIGKTTILAEAVRQLKRERAEDSNKSRKKLGSRFWLTNASRLIAGMQYLGQWEERVEQMIDELSEIQGVLCIENLLQLVQTGSSEPSASLAGFLRHFMMNNELQMVAECNRRELEAIRRLLPGLDSFFHVIEVAPMGSQMAAKVLRSIADQQNQSHKIIVEDRTISLCQYLFERFMPYDGFPGKCVVFWKKLLQSEIELKKERLDDDRLVTEFVEQTGLPEFLVRDEILLDSSSVVQHFRSRIIGQDEACHAVSQLVVAFKAGMNDPARPIGVHLYCGPTGVGKTEMAKALADYLFGAGHHEDDNQIDDRLIRLDMSEYAAPGSAEKLLIDQRGQPSKLVQRIRQIPFVVLLLDEIEKAAPEVFDALMTVFDEGRMVDRLGREAHFCSSVIVMTSNLGTANADPIGFDASDPSGYEKEVRKFFRPEFFNRLDKVIAFQHLDRDSICSIAEKEIQALEKREGLANRHIRVRCSDQLIRQVAEMGYDRKLGARPLQRTIEKRIITPLARWLTENPEAQMTTLELSLAGERVVVQKHHG